jgi:hypothetical protein
MSTSMFTTVRMGDIIETEPIGGIRQKDEGDSGNRHCWVPTSAVSRGQGIIHRAPLEKTYGPVAEARTTQRHDLLLVGRGLERGMIASCARVDFDEPAAFAESLIRLRVKPSLAVPEYVRLYLTSRKGSAALAAAATGSLISNLSRRALQDVELRLPSFLDQVSIVDYMTSLDTKLAMLADTIEVLRDLQDTAREGLMSGTVVVTSSDHLGLMSTSKRDRSRKESA